MLELPCHPHPAEISDIPYLCGSPVVDIPRSDRCQSRPGRSPSLTAPPPQTNKSVVQSRSPVPEVLYRHRPGHHDYGSSTTCRIEAPLWSCPQLGAVRSTYSTQKKGLSRRLRLAFTLLISSSSANVVPSLATRILRDRFSLAVRHLCC
jgi:hypothetical protein